MIFTIKAGRHSANNWWRWRILFGNTLRFRYRLHPGAEYDPRSVINGWSKLFGFASPLVHRNSIRIVWKNTETGLKSGLYFYTSGVSPQDDSRNKMEIGTIYPSLWYEVEITRKKTCWAILHGLEDMRPDRFKIFHNNKWWPPIHFICHPFVGGKFTLDNDVFIEIEKLKANS